VLERFEELTGEARNGRWLTACRYEMPHIERPALGAAYPEIIERVAEIIDRLPENGRCTLVADVTGCGRPVVDLMRRRRLKPWPVTICTGASITNANGATNLAKRDLISNLQILFQTDRLRVAKALPLADVLIRELQEFKMRRKTADMTDEAWRETEQDDMVLATAIGAWHGERLLGSVLRLPPLPVPPRPAPKGILIGGKSTVTMNELWASAGGRKESADRL
jgi:hypothetical protein